jgi:hypothetical protein
LPWFIPILIALALEVLTFLIEPQPRPPQVAQEKAPTADADKPIPWIFGEIRVDATNVLWVGELASRTYKVSS